MLQEVLVHLKSGLQVSIRVILDSHANAMLEQPAGDELILAIHQERAAWSGEVTLIDESVKKC